MLKPGSTGNRRHLMCITCNQVLPIGDFPLTASYNKYSRICPNCKDENDRNTKLMEEMGRDPDWSLYMKESYGGIK